MHALYLPASFKSGSTYFSAFSFSNAFLRDFTRTSHWKRIPDDKIVNQLKLRKVSRQVTSNFINCRCFCFFFHDSDKNWTFTPFWMRDANNCTHLEACEL